MFYEFPAPPPASGGLHIHKWNENIFNIPEITETNTRKVFFRVADIVGLEDQVQVSTSPDFANPLLFERVNPMRDAEWAVTTLQLPDVQGPVTLHARTGNEWGWSNVVTDTVLLDTIGPVIGRPVPAGARAFGEMTFTWPPATDGSGVKEIAAQLIRDQDGSTADVQRLPGTATSVTFRIPAGEVMRLRVVATDMLDNDGVAAPDSDPVHGNSAPTIALLGVVPALARTDDDVRANLMFHDTDGDFITASEVEWRQEVAGGGGAVVSGAILPANRTAKGQTWQLRARAFDGYLWSDNLFHSITIANTPPTMPFVQILPLVPTPGSDLAVEVLNYSTDADGDQVRYDFTWFRSRNNGPWVRRAELDGQPVVNRLYIQENDRWRLEYTPYDGERKDETKALEFGLPGWDEVFVGNNRLPLLQVNAPVTTWSTQGVGVSVNFTASDPDNEPAEVEVYWTDLGISGLHPLGKVPVSAGKFMAQAQIPTDRPVYLHLVARDIKGGLRRVTTGVLSIAPTNAAAWMMY